MSGKLFHLIGLKALYMTFEYKIGCISHLWTSQLNTPFIYWSLVVYLLYMHELPFMRTH